jgi:cytochrome c2
MSFAGLKKATDRADIIAYLRQSADSPPALPAE